MQTSSFGTIYSGKTQHLTRFLEVYLLPSLYAWYVLPFSILCFKMLELRDVVELAILSPCVEKVRKGTVMH